ncbi:MAG: transporter substrate-binding domain-containing protein [Pseudomonas sp.]|uniref:transporter substrate-binding domain-containing protein n=1 Tax=Pseudomonas sp. TaxID=306 RepID=UPI0027331AB2|nr:transporter substrate-binding domain-containing protein [Pseudomonas sp.]MDP3845406.1 transporter substrate-binding domain-containing protein [Pseudomonas sp.]
MRVACYLAAWLLSLACWPLAVLAATPCERLVATADTQAPPYLWQDPAHPRQLLGANADLLKHLSRELGVQIKLLDSGSWAAAQQEVRSGRSDLLLGAFLSLPEPQQYDFILPPVWPGGQVSADADPLASLVPGAQSDSTPPMLENPAQYLALGRDSACNTPLLRGQLAKKMAELRASGLLEALLKSNLARWQAQQLQVLLAPGTPTQ